MPYIDNSPTGEIPSLEPIAICGMACRLPGQVDSCSSLWDMLVKKNSGNSIKVPKTRFNIDAHYHRNNERPGSFNALGGYFLDGPAENFDPTFFNMTPIEAMWLDPQQRKILETCYEAIESAGLTLDSIAGTNTAVYVGSFTADYQQMTFRDPDFRHSFAATGVDPGIISNRVGNVFDLKGPSFTINTACSSSVYAVHNACHALRAGDCEAALVGGVNLILTVDQHMNTAKLGVLSPTSFCHTFDASADGYGRGEGAGVLYLKRLRDAVRDGDVIRAVIRSSAVTTNGKVPGYGITYPNAKGQEAAIRTAYKRSGLDPNKTAYFECHGTGTPVGDPIEVRAASNAMNDTRSRDKPLLVGAVKPNIGHSEAASGIFAIMKAAMMVESGIVPGVAGLRNVNPEIPEKALNIKINKDTSLWPPGFDTRRASVSSFGYGGTNGHVMVEDIHSLLPQYQHGARKGLSLQDHSSSRPLLVTFSAHDKMTLTRNIEAHAKIADQYYLADLAYTLNLKRTQFPQKAFTVASESSVNDDMQMSNFKFRSSNNATTQVVFMFTGQGAQWAGVGRDAIKTFPVFCETIRKLDRVLKGVQHPPNFTLEEELCAPIKTSRINTAKVAQATLVATQIAIVDLLSSWNILPVATVGNSAGEYAASYAAGLASAPELIIAAYYRGYALEHYAPSGGSMLAVGKGLDEMEPYLSRFDEDIVVACENSPNSVTLSGTALAIQGAKKIFETESIFARELKTGMAYHSPQMKTVAGPMVKIVSQAYQKLDFFDRQWRCPRRTMISSVTNVLITEKQIGPEYWASNLTSRVLFNTAVSNLVTTIGSDNIGGFVEVGPHSALAGPFKQICKGNTFNNFSYVATLQRNEDSAHNLLRAAGELYLEGYPIDMYMVNQLEPSSNAMTLKGSGILPSILVDLPPYQWNYSKMFWAEPRNSAEYRQPSHARHDLLGSKVPGLSDRSMVWRNILRLKDIPWLQDHKLGGSIMFPAAGHMALAIEAVRQHCEIKKIEMMGVTLRNVNLKTALIIPENDAGIEIQLRLSQTNPSSENIPYYIFSVESCSYGVWTVHSEGSIVSLNTAQGFPTSTRPVNQDVLSQKTTGKRWNDTFRRVGFEYGPSFDMLTNVRTHEKYYQAAGQIPVRTTTTNSMVDESRYMLHPSTVDCLLQLCIVSIHAGLYQEMPWGVVPIKFEEVNILLPDDDANTIGHAFAWNSIRGNRARFFNTDSQLATEAGKVILDIKGLHTVAYEAALPPRSESPAKPLPYAGVVWKPDLTISAIEDVFSNKTQGSLAADAMLDVIDFSSHKQPLSSVLVVDAWNQLEINQIQSRLPATADLHVARGEVNGQIESSIDHERVKFITLPEAPTNLDNVNLKPQDLVIISHKDSTSLVSSGSLSSVNSLVGDKGQGFDLTVVLDLSNEKATSNQTNVQNILDLSDIAGVRQMMRQAKVPVTVIAEEFSAFEQDIWRNIPSDGCFVLNENKQKTLTTAPEIGPFNRGARFGVTTIASRFEIDPSCLGKILQTSVSIFGVQIHGFINPPSVVNVNTLREASESAVDRSVLSYNYENDIVDVTPPKIQLRFSSEDVFLLVGCLDGLGRSLTSWMMDRGARHFVFISRSGSDKPEAAQLVDSITKAGAIPQVFRGDASNVGDLSYVIKTVTAKRHIKGVVHAAMVLQDGMLGPKMTIDKFKAALVPKVDGAHALHNVLKDHDLDFFVMTSSISATIGQPGQSNYAAANSFLDNLAWQRNLMGLPATSLVLPMVLGVGVVAENDFLEDKISRRGMYGIDEREMLRGFEAAMSQPIPNLNDGPRQCNSTIVLGLEPSRLATALAAAGENTDITWYEDARFSNLRPMVDASAGQEKQGAGKSGAGCDFTEQFKATAIAKDGGYQAALEMTAKHIMNKCATILMMGVDDFEMQGQSIGGYGLDSMIGAELRNWLFKELKLNIAFQDLLATTLTFSGLSTLVLGNLGVSE